MAEDRYARAEETEHERLKRNLNELLQELRVAQAGVQFLFGFLLAVAFTEPYLRGTDFQHIVHLVAVVFATASVALLSAPAAWHRVLFRKGQRPMIIETAHRFAIVGMACLAVSMTATVLLLTDAVLGHWFSAVITAVTAAMFGTLWFLLPMLRRFDLRDGRAGTDRAGGGDGAGDFVGDSAEVTNGDTAGDADADGRAGVSSARRTSS